MNNIDVLLTPDTNFMSKINIEYGYPSSILLYFIYNPDQKVISVTVYYDSPTNPYTAFYQLSTKQNTIVFNIWDGSCLAITLDLDTMDSDFAVIRLTSTELNVISR